VCVCVCVCVCVSACVCTYIYIYIIYIYIYIYIYRRHEAAGNQRGAHDDSGSVVRAQHWVEPEQQEPVQPSQAATHCMRPSGINHKL